MPPALLLWRWRFFCVQVFLLESPLPHTANTKPVLGTLHQGAQKPHGVCAGDCNSDNECVGDLKCKQNSNWGLGTPGCNDARVGSSFYDFCYDPSTQWLPSTNMTWVAELAAQGRECAYASAPRTKITATLHHTYVETANHILKWGLAFSVAFS